METTCKHELSELYFFHLQRKSNQNKPTLAHLTTVNDMYSISLDFLDKIFNDLRWCLYFWSWAHSTEIFILQVQAEIFFKIKTSRNLKKENH